MRFFVWNGRKVGGLVSERKRKGLRAEEKRASRRKEKGPAACQVAGGRAGFVFCCVLCWSDGRRGQGRGYGSPAKICVRRYNKNR